VDTALDGSHNATQERRQSLEGSITYATTERRPALTDSLNTVVTEQRAYLAGDWGTVTEEQHGPSLTGGLNTAATEQREVPERRTNLAVDWDTVTEERQRSSLTGGLNTAAAEQQRMIVASTRQDGKYESTQGYKPPATSTPTDVHSSGKFNTSQTRQMVDAVRHPLESDIDEQYCGMDALPLEVNQQ